MSRPLLCSVFIGFGLILSQVAIAAESTAESQQAKPAAAELVQAVIDSENKVQDVESLYLRFEGRWARTPAAIAEARAELQKQFPKQEIDERRFTNLWPEMTEVLEVAFDKSRVRSLSESTKAQRDLRVFDGQQAIAHVEYFTHPQESFALRPQPQEFFSQLLSNLSWLRVGQPHLWFIEDRFEPEIRAQLNGLPQDYEHVGFEQIDGRECYVLENQPARRRLSIGVDDRRLHRLTLYILDNGADIKLAVAKAAGRTFANATEEKAWSKGLSKQEESAFARRLLRETFSLARPWVIHNLDDYREVAPGLWLPYSQGYSFMDKKAPQQAQFTRTLKVVECRVNQPLDDALFKIELKEGVQVADYTHDPPLFYKYKTDRTPEEFEAIIAEHRKQSEAWQKQNAARDELLGQTAPDLPQGEWINGNALDWNALKGKVVVLDFWATSCGPCRADLPHVEELHKQRDNSGIVAIGVHSSGAEREEVTEFAKEMELSYPIVIDDPAARRPSFGKFFSEFAVQGIPYTFVIDREGRVVAHGRLNEVLPKARQLAAESN